MLSPTLRSTTYGAPNQTEMWLVFRDEGTSLRHYLYTEREAEGFVLHGQSNFWRDMRLDPKGPEV
ncbi:unnamed protein product, partial [Hapterophycus canaliculatus]